MDKEFRAGRREAVMRQWALFPDMTLPEICMKLRGGVNGSSDPPWEKEDVDAAVQMLKDRLRWWEPPSDREAGVDNAVQLLVEATIREAERYGTR